MTEEFLGPDFLLHSKTAKLLYHDYGAKMPIFDFHCHLPAADIASDTCFQNLTQAWLYGDHYKWRAMRTNGVDERYCTGDATDAEKFAAFAATIPSCIGNPLYHWTHLELKRYFHEDRLLNDQTADQIFERTGLQLQSTDFSVRNLLRKQNVKLVCTTEDPLDDLAVHEQIRSERIDIAVHTSWRPDRSMACEDVPALNQWIDGLGALVNVDINRFETYIEAIRKRHLAFHQQGCRLSDRGLKHCYVETYTDPEINGIFDEIRQGIPISVERRLKFKSALLYELARMDHERGWVQQLHLGALRNNNSRLLAKLGPDTGFDSIGDWPQAESLSRFLDRLDQTDQLPRTILYNLNPKDSPVLVSMAGNFQDGSTPGKIQFGAAWWFMDQKHGMEEHLAVLGGFGLLSRFVGMVTDSRSFLSYPRHEYFRRILCNFLGQQVDRGELPNDTALLGSLVQDICFHNANDYFSMACDGS